MEVGRGIPGSNNDSRERRRMKTKKKFGSLPLGAFLSFNDRGVHPKCPNASNSYHKCGRHCFDKIPAEGDPDRRKKFEKEGVNPNCPNASNPYHKCAEYCFEKLQDQPAMKAKEEKKAGLTTDRLVKYECKFTSNPYHVCAKHCLESVPARDQPEHTMRLKSSREVKKGPRRKERTTGSPPPCQHKSIPYHECTEICLPTGPNKNFADREKPDGDSIQSDKRSAHLNRSASVPFRTMTEYCLEDTLEKEHPKRDDSEGDSTKADKNAIKPKEESDIFATAKSRVKLEGRSNNSHGSTTFCAQNLPDRKIKEEIPGSVSVTADNTSEHHKPKPLSSPYQKMSEYCIEDTTENELTEGGVKKLEEEIEMVRSLSEGEHHEEGKSCADGRKNASSPYCVRANDSYHNIPVKAQSEEGSMKSKKDEVVVPLEGGLSFRCINASNPYHVCADYCFQDDPRGRAMGKAKEEKEVFSSLTKMNSECKNASNPFHKCADFCNENALGRDQPGKTFPSSKEKEIVDFTARVVNPDCQFASNRYHACDGYCFQNVPKREKRRQDIMKLKGLKELKNLVSNKKITRRPPQCNFASNRYHKCTEYCLNGNMPDGAMKLNERKKDDNYSTRRDVDPSHKHASKKNEEAEGITMTFKEKKRDSLEDGMKRRGVESKHVFASNPINDKFDLNDITRELHSAKAVKMKNVTEPDDVQRVDSSEILHEWAKYCSQKGADEVGMSLQEKIGNVEGEVFLKDYASENLKVQTSGRLACSLPISLLYFIGFVFSAVYWIQMIHSFIMSPEKVDGGERMKAEGAGDRECRNVSDPYHFCADRCFRRPDE